MDFTVGGLGVILIVLAFWTVRRSTNQIVSWCGLLWAMVALCTSISVWGEPTNLIRAIAPLWPLVCINLAESRKQRLAGIT
jgi:hypothetical protein